MPLHVYKKNAEVQTGYSNLFSQIGEQYKYRIKHACAKRKSWIFMPSFWRLQNVLVKIWSDMF